MTILDRYIGLAVVGGTFFVMFVLLSLFAFIGIVNELDDIGKGSYGYLQAIEYILLTLPRVTYQLFPVTALLGSMAGLGILASHSELIVMRAAGVSLWRITLSVMKAALLLMLLVTLLGEGIAPKSEQYAQELRSTALSGNVALKTREGFWTRDGDRFINVRAVLANGELGNVNVYEFDDERRLTLLTHADTAAYKNGAWELHQVIQNQFDGDMIKVINQGEVIWPSLVNLDLLDVVAIRQENLSIPDLYKYAEYLKENNLNAAHYELAFWTKIILPFTTGVMVFLSIPLIFGPLRSVGIGQRILVGSMVGIGFYIFNQLVGQAGLAYDINTTVSAVLPTVVFFLLSVLMLRRIH